MSGSETYWRNLIDELVAITSPLGGGEKLDSDEPAWVDKLTFEIFNMIAPKMQLRAGKKPTADSAGVMLGSYLVQLGQAKAMAHLPKPTTESARAVYDQAYELATPPDLRNGPELMQRHLPEVERQIESIIGRVLKDRSSRDAAEFYRGFGRGLEDTSRSLMPQIENGRPKYTAKQFELVRRLIVYVLARHRWRELDQLKTSQEAFEWFEKRVPPEFLGNDPERIRKMFYRVGKRFKEPGRPKKGTPSS